MKLIVNADDFGLSSGVNYGIYKAHIDGIVTSTTLMVTMPAVEEAKNLSKKAPNLAIGLHLNITLGKPLTSCHSLINNDGIFYKPKEKPNQDLFNEEEIYLEFLAQYELFVKIMGKKPTHIDSHLYAHQKYKKALNAALKLSNEKKIAIRNYENDCYEKTVFIDNFKFQKNKDLKQILIEKLRNNSKNNQTYELMVHPAYLDQFVLKNSSYTIGRTIELEILISDEIKQLINEQKIELVDFSQTRRITCQE